MYLQMDTDGPGPGGFNSTQQNPTRSNVTSSGTYSLFITENGCEKQAGTTTVTVNSTPNAPSPSNNGPLCSGEDLQLSANESADGYRWTGPGGFNSTQQNPTRSNVTSSGTYSLFITENGCESQAGTTVTVNSTPNAPSPSNNGPLCSGEDLQLSANESADGYRWTGPGGFNSTQQNPTRSNVTSSGTYSLFITENGCESQAGTTTVTVNSTPNAPSPSNNGPLCSGEDLQLSANESADGYRWTGPGGFNSTQQNPTRSNVTSSGTYSLFITENGCESQAGTTTVTVNSTPNAPSPSNNGPLCSGEDLQLSANESADGYRWTGPGGFNSTQQNPTRSNVTSSGTYSLFITENGCESQAGTTTVTVNPTPNAPNPSNDGPICSGEDVNFSANVSADGYRWTGQGWF